MEKRREAWEAEPNAAKRTVDKEAEVRKKEGEEAAMKEKRREERGKAKTSGRVKRGSRI